MNVLSENLTIENIWDTSIHSHNMYWITKLLLISFEALQNNKIVLRCVEHTEYLK